MGYAHWQTQLREHQLRHHIHGSHYQQNICSMLVLSTSHQYLGRGFIMDKTENCPTITMDQFTLSKHVSDRQAQACSLLCHQHQIVS